SRPRSTGTLLVGPVAPARRPRRIAGRGNAAPAGEPPMITRRDLVKWGAVAPAVAVTPGVTWARMPQGVDALVVDRRLGAAVPSFDARQVYPIDGDVTALWYDVLDTRWRRPGFVLAGLTGRDTLFVLETLAADRGRR